MCRRTLLLQPGCGTLQEHRPQAAAQRSASSGDKSLVSSSAESLYRCCAKCRLSPENAVARGRRVIVPTEPSMSRGLLPHIIPAH